MAEEIDRNLIPEVLRTTFSISLGAAFRTIEMMKNPGKTMSDMMSEMKSLVSIPPDTGSGIEEKAKALAGVWMEKGMSVVEECRAAGEKFTGAK